MRISTKLLTVDSNACVMCAELSDLTRSYLPQCIEVESHVTGKVIPFSTDANNEIWAGGSTTESELLGWHYHSPWLPGWVLTVFND